MIWQLRVDTWVGSKRGFGKVALVWDSGTEDGGWCWSMSGDMFERYSFGERSSGTANDFESAKAKAEDCWQRRVERF